MAVVSRGSAFEAASPPLRGIVEAQVRGASTMLVLAGRGTRSLRCASPFATLGAFTRTSVPAELVDAPLQA